MPNGTDRRSLFPLLSSSNVSSLFLPPPPPLSFQQGYDREKRRLCAYISSSVYTWKYLGLYFNGSAHKGVKKCSTHSEPEENVIIPDWKSRFGNALFPSSDSPNTQSVCVCVRLK